MILTKKKRVKRSRKSPRLDLVTGQDETTTLGQHLAELQNRLFAVAVCFLLFSVLAYPFFDKIVSFLISPLGQDHKLVYLTPGGAFGFIIQACMYIGFVVVLPLIIYNTQQRLCYLWLAEVRLSRLWPSRLQLVSESVSLMIRQSLQDLLAMALVHMVAIRLSARTYFH